MQTQIGLIGIPLTHCHRLTPSKRNVDSFDWSSGVQKVGTADTAGARQTTFGWTKNRFR